MQALDVLMAGATSTLPQMLAISIELAGYLLLILTQVERVVKMQLDLKP